MQVSQVVHADDVMWNTGQSWYYSVGESGLKAVQSVLGLSRKREVKTILDLPCGHGRVARYLRAGFPGAKLTFCDLDESGAEFCAREFGGSAELAAFEGARSHVLGKTNAVKGARRLRLTDERLLSPRGRRRGSNIYFAWGCFQF